MTGTNDDQKRDEVLKRLLETPPQPKGGKAQKEGEKKPKKDKPAK